MLLGLFFGLIFALEFVFVTDVVRRDREIGYELKYLFQMGSFLTPILLLGSYLMARVPPAGFSTRKNKGYDWEVYVGLPLLSFVGTACVCVMLYMGYEAFVDFSKGKVTPCTDHLTALAVTIFYSYIATKVVSFIETRSAKSRVKHMKEMKVKNAEQTELKKKRMQAMGAVIIDDDDDLPPEFGNEKHEL
jgi:hypothetical protein